MRVSAASAAAIASALALIAVAERTSAQSTCQAAFEKWAILSSAQVRPVQDGSGRGACIPNEAVRRSLLDALARAGGVCGDSSDASQQPTRTLISINQSFITALSVCQTASAESDEGWSAKSAPEKAPDKAPDKARPKLAAPLTAPTPPPVSGGPRPSVITPTPPKESDTAAPKPPCLEVAASQGDVHSLVNRRCKGHTVLAVIETRNASGETACKGYTVGVGVNLKGAGTPRVNYECIASAGGCNKDRLGDMFPECDW